MPSGSIVLNTNIRRTPRIAQLEGMFDLKAQELSTTIIDYDLELPSEWNVGVIVGPSGTGKTQLARRLWPDKMQGQNDTEKDEATVDIVGPGMSIKEVCKVLSSVGFSSPPSWLRPLHALSNGEKFRVEIARAILDGDDLCVVDEFTSVVDRTVAKVTSAAVAKYVRKRATKIVAISCHYDILEWMEPDWIYDTSTRRLTVGRSLRRPSMPIIIGPCVREAWNVFGRHHYLSAKIQPQGKWMAAWYEDHVVAFVAVIRSMHPSSKRIWRVHRIVTMPDFQGVGIGVVLLRQAARCARAARQRLTITTSHPSMIGHLSHSSEWSVRRAMLPGATDNHGPKSAMAPGGSKTNAMRFTISAEYIGAAGNETDEKLWAEASIADKSD